MKIKTNATLRELDSPFFKANKNFCRDFERFIASKNGMVKGNYNAWSFTVFGKIESKKVWYVKYKKAVYSSTGSLYSVFYKNEVLLNLVKWTCTNTNDKEASIFIRKRRFLDNLNFRFSRLERHRDYVIRTKRRPSKFFSQVIGFLQPLFESEEIYTIRLKNGELIIELRSDQQHFDILSQLLVI